MSVEAAVDNLISTLKGLSHSTRDQAVSLINQAGAAFNGVNPPRMNPIRFEAERTTTMPVRVPKPTSLDEIETFVSPESGGIQDITPFNARFTASPPQIDLPDAVNTRLPLLPVVTASIPRPPRLTTEIDSSLVTVFPDAPTLTSPQEFRTNPLSGNPPDVPLPEFKTFDEDFFDEYQRGLDDYAPDLAAFSGWVRRLYSDAVERLDGVFTSRILGVLRGTETAVPAAWTAQRHTQVVQDIRSERQDALTGLDDAPSSQTGLPTGQRLWAHLELELKTLRDTTKSASKAAVLRRELEVKHLQWAMQLCGQWVEAAIALKAQEVGWRMKGAQLALEGATQALALAVRVLETKEQEVQFFVQYNETQTQRTELRFKMEQTKLAELKSVLASNQLKGTFDQHQLQVYQGAITIVEQCARKYQTEIEYQSTQKQVEKLKLRLYEAQVKTFEANVNAYTAEQQALTARIKGDVARVEGELVKVRQFQAQVRTFEAEVAGLSATVTAQTAQNTALLAEYNALLDGKLTELRSFDTVLRLAVTALLQGYEAEAAEVSLELSQQDLADRVVLDNALRALQKDHTETLLEMEKYGLQFAQRQAQGAVIAQGAGTVGGMATQAFSSLNAVGAQEILEDA